MKMGFKSDRSGQSGCGICKQLIILPWNRPTALRDHVCYFAAMASVFPRFDYP